MTPRTPEATAELKQIIARARFTPGQPTGFAVSADTVEAALWEWHERHAASPAARCPNCDGGDPAGPRCIDCGEEFDLAQARAHHASPAAPEGETPLRVAGQRLADAATRYADRLHAEAPKGTTSPVAELWRLLAADWTAALATPPAPPAPELDFVNAQTPLEPEARAILNRNRAELYLGPPAPVATMPEIEAGDKIRLWSLVSTSQWEVRETDGREIRCRVDGSDGWGEWLKASSVDEIERNGEVLWRRPDEGRR